MATLYFNHNNNLNMVHVGIFFMQTNVVETVEFVLFMQVQNAF